MIDRCWSRRILIGVVAAAMAVTMAPISLAHAGGPPPEQFLLNDSPVYTFLPDAGPPTRGAPAAVAQLSLAKTKGGVEIDVTQLARFAPESQTVNARVVFYGRSGSIGGGVEFVFGASPEDTRVIERTGEGTAESPEEWDDADADYAVTDLEYSFPTTHLTITADGEYGRLLRDNRTAVGLDLLPGGTSVQPSARVSIGDLTGSRPGLLAGQGTGVGADLTPQPWITRPTEGGTKGLRLSAEYDDPQQATVDIGKSDALAEQIRLFTGERFTAVAPGASFAPYNLIIFATADTETGLRRGDAFRSDVIGAVVVTLGKNPGEYSLGFSLPVTGSVLAVQVVVPGASDSVLLSGVWHTF